MCKLESTLFGTSPHHITCNVVTGQSCHKNLISQGLRFFTGFTHKTPDVLCSEVDDKSRDLVSINCAFEAGVA